MYELTTINIFLGKQQYNTLLFIVLVNMYTHITIQYYIFSKISGTNMNYDSIGQLFVMLLSFTKTKFLVGPYKKTLNKIMHTKNGNIFHRKKANLEIVQWNKGLSEFIKRKPHIEQIIIDHSPHLIVVNKFNLHKSEDDRIATIPGYRLELDSLLVTRGVARTAVYISDSIIYKRRKDLESVDNSIIWVSVGFPNQKKILIQCVYRQ